MSAKFIVFVVRLTSINARTWEIHFRLIRRKRAQLPHELTTLCHVA